MTRPYKQVLLYRRDLKMRKGKIAAQCAHASLSAVLRPAVRATAVGANPLPVPMSHEADQWLRFGQAKIVLSVDDEQALLTAHAAALAAGLPCALITDAGHTEFKGVPTRTALAIGPAAVRDIDAITGPEGMVKTKLA
ncbi:MAG: aminoacyl-tRNA hydrolase [Myxococcota bacterium]|nr:aminoacyl-tRNA hydrolase [Myxococcota bacterium]